MTDVPHSISANGAVIEVPLNRLKASPRNARKTPHGEAAIAALAASIAAKGLLQAPVVQAETGGDGAPTGDYLVTIGEGRRLALKRLVKRKMIPRTAPVRCVLYTANDPFEISLDENVTRSDMHPADQFEAFTALAQSRGLGVEDIAARFGVSAHVVRQRLRLGAASPRLMAAYREGEITLDVLMAFAVTEDHERQEQVFAQLSWNRTARNVRAAMTETKVAARDRRAVFVGLDAYAEAGGSLLRDLFTEDGGGWLEDVALLERLAGEKLTALAQDIQAREGWKWAQGHLDYPQSHGFSRVYAHRVQRSAAEMAQRAALGAEYRALVRQGDGVEDPPPEVEGRLKAIDAALEAMGSDYAFDPDDLARGGVFVILGHDGEAKVERGLIRPEDATPAPDLPDVGDDDVTPPSESDGEAPAEHDEQDEEEGAGAPLSERLVLELTAHRTLALRDALAGETTVALNAVVHALTLGAFYPPHARASCLEIKAVSPYLAGHAPGIEQTLAGRSVAARHEAWARRLPREAAELWAYIGLLPADDLLALLAHVASLTLNALRNPLDPRPNGLAHAEALAQAVELDMGLYWSATAPAYLSRVTKARVLDAVRDGVSVDAAARLEGMKKPVMVEAAAELLAGTGWLPPLLRTGACSPSSDRLDAEA